MGGAQAAAQDGAHAYRICGLKVRSDLYLPGAIETEGAPAEPAVTIALGPVPEALENPGASGPTWEMTDDAFLLRVPRVGRFLMTAGRSIAVGLAPDASEKDAAGFVLGTCYGILLHQRGMLTLHASAVARDGRAIAICGHSGAGKSTLAAALCARGYDFVTDDICAVGLNQAGRPVIYPDGRQLKLWKKSIEKLDLEERQGAAVRETFEKYYVAPADSADEPTALSAIYLLREARPSCEPGIEPLSLADAMGALDYEAYRPGLKARMGQTQDMVARAAATLSHAQVFRLTRPMGFGHMDAVVEGVLAHWESLD